MDEAGKPTAEHLKGERGVRRVWNALLYSVAGFSAAFRDEAAFRQLCWLNAVLLGTALWLEVSRPERALLMLAPLLCLIVELLNTAIENTVDRVSMEIHPLSKNAKDMGSAAQLVCLFMVVTVWSVILL
jgi:diacylglycerol kinase (ATP)